MFEQDRVSGFVNWSWRAGAQTIESGPAVRALAMPEAAPEVAVGVAFHYFGAYEYRLAYTPLP